MKLKKFLRVLCRVLRSVFRAALGILLLAGLYLAGAKVFEGQTHPTFFGFSSAVVLTGSMSPAIEPNDIIVSRKQSSYAVGDIITFDAGGSSVTHRIVSVGEDGMRTKGDANNTEDAQPIKQSRVIGKVILVIPRLGAAVGFLKTPLGILCFLGAAVLLFEAPELFRSARKKRKTEKR